MARAPEPVQPQPEPSKPETTPAGDPAPEPVQPEPQPAMTPMSDWTPRSPYDLHPETLALISDYVVKDLDELGITTEDARDTLTAPEALIEVMKRVQPIEKGRQADQKAGGYKFRGIDDAYNALHDVMSAVGLVVMPKVLERLREQRTTAGGGTNHVTSLHIEFTFIARDGSRETCSTWGEGGDTGDKSTQKAHSQALKTALLEVFMIPTQASAVDDPDATNVEPGRAFTPDEVERAGKAYNAALEATNVEALAGVRHRALALLDVPVRMVDETLVPLGLLFDQRRTAIERNTQAQPA